MSPTDVIVQIVLNDIAAIANREALQSQAMGQQARAFGGAAAQNDLTQTESIGQIAVASNAKDIQIAIPKTGGKPVEHYTIELNISNLFAGAGGVIRQDQGGQAGAGAGQNPATGDSVEISADAAQAGAASSQASVTPQTSEEEIRDTVAETRPNQETEAQTSENQPSGETPVVPEPKAAPADAPEPGAEADEAADTGPQGAIPVPERPANGSPGAGDTPAEGSEAPAEPAEGQAQDASGPAGQESGPGTPANGVPAADEGAQEQAGQPESESGGPVSPETETQEAGPEGQSAPGPEGQETPDSTPETQPTDGSAAETESPAENPDSHAETADAEADAEAAAARRAGYEFISAGQFNPALFVSLDDTFRLTFSNHLRALSLVSLNNGYIPPESKFLSKLPKISGTNLVA